MLSKILNRRGIYLALAVLFAGVFIFVFLSRQPQSVLPIIQSPLQKVPFPTETIAFPDNWPNDLIYPKAFRLVETQSGDVPESAIGGYAAKLYFVGDMDEAIQEIGSFFTSNGWLIAETTKLDGEGVLVDVEKGDTGYAIITLEPDPEAPEQIRLLVVVFP